MNFVRLHVIPLIAVLMLMLTFDDVQAEYPRGFLLAGNLRQSLGFTYDYASNNYKNSSNSQHTLAEIYNVSLDYAVANPRILNGNIALQLEADQRNSSGSNQSSSSEDTFKLLYDIKASLIDKSPIPLNLLLQSQVQEVQTPYTGNYQYYYDIYGATWSLKNQIIPLTLNALYSDSRTEGLQTDRQTSHSEVGLNGRHNRGISQTTLNLKTRTDRVTYSNSPDTDFERYYDFELDNILRWDNNEKFRNLYSSIKLRDETGTNSGRSFTLNESLDWELGRALKTGLTYSLSHVSNSYAEQDTNSGSIWLSHLLYKSLNTHLQGNARDTTFGGGSETDVSGKVSLDYRKILPDDSSLAMQTYWQYGVTERQSTNLQQPVLDEPHEVIFGQTIWLDNLNYLPGTIIIRNANPGVRLQPYIEGPGADFEAIPQPGGRTEIRVSGEITNDSQIPGGSRLLISYQYKIESDIRFSTTSLGVGGDLNLYNGRYRFYTRIDKYTQDALSLEASTLGLGYQTALTAGFETRKNKYFISTVYANLDGSSQSMQSIDALASYSDELGAGSATLFLKNSYRWYGETGGVTRDPDDLLSMGGTYRRPVILNGLLTLTTNYDRFMSTSSSDRLSVTAQINWYFRKLTVALQSRVGVSRTQDSTSHVEHLRLSIIRFF